MRSFLVNDCHDWEKEDMPLSLYEKIDVCWFSIDMIENIENKYIDGKLQCHCFNRKFHCIQEDEFAQPQPWPWAREELSFGQWYPTERWMACIEGLNYWLSTHLLQLQVVGGCVWFCKDVITIGFPKIAGYLKFLQPYELISLHCSEVSLGQKPFHGCTILIVHPRKI